MVMNTESHSWQRSRESGSVECSTLNGISISHPLIPRLKDNCRKENTKTIKEPVNDYKETVSSRHSRPIVHKN